MGLLFAPLAPLVALAAALVFWTTSWVYKYQLIYIFVTQAETGGVSTQFVHIRLILIVIRAIASVERCRQPSAVLCHFHATLDDSQ